MQSFKLTELYIKYISTNYLKFGLCASCLTSYNITNTLATHIALSKQYVRAMHNKSFSGSRTECQGMCNIRTHNLDIKSTSWRLHTFDTPPMQSITRMRYLFQNITRRGGCTSPAGPLYVETCYHKISRICKIWVVRFLTLKFHKSFRISGAHVPVKYQCDAIAS